MLWEKYWSVLSVKLDYKHNDCQNQALPTSRSGNDIAFTEWIAFVRIAGLKYCDTSAQNLAKRNTPWS